MRLSSVFSIALLTTLLVSPASAATLTHPTELSYGSDNITQAVVTVDWTKVTIPGAGTFSTRAYFVNGVAQFPGPLLRLKPGGHLNLTIVNNLGANSAADASRVANQYRHVNTTNIHTHGLHADPAIDSIFRKAEPGSTLNYYLPLPAAHYPGTHWYHAHHHGASNIQLMGGLFGMMVVDPSGVTIPTAISSLTEEIFVIHPMKFSSSSGVQDCNGRNANHDPFRVWSFSDLESEMGSAVTASQNLTISDTDFLLVNGQYMPSVNFAPGQSKVFRFLYGAGFGHPKVRINGGSCSMKVIAVDGVYIDTPRTATSLVFVPASRFDVVVTCTTAGTFNVENFDNSADFRGNFATIVVSGTSTTSAVVPTSLTSITKPYYLQDMSSATGTSFHEISFAQAGAPECMWVFGQGTDCGGQPPADCSTAVFSGERGTTAADASKYSHAPKLGEIEEWTVVAGGNEPHPLHIHVNHFQIVGFTAAGTSTLADYGLELGEWHDTIPALDGETKIRFKTYTFTGEIVMHCHILSHEDRGLMSTWMIQPADTPAPTPAPPTTTNASTASPSTATPGTTQPGTPPTPAPGSNTGSSSTSESVGSGTPTPGTSSPGGTASPTLASSGAALQHSLSAIFATVAVLLLFIH